jgi:hypothetical protein
MRTGRAEQAVLGGVALEQPLVPAGGAPVGAEWVIDAGQRQPLRENETQRRTSPTALGRSNDSGRGKQGALKPLLQPAHMSRSFVARSSRRSAARICSRASSAWLRMQHATCSTCDRQRTADNTQRRQHATHSRQHAADNTQRTADNTDHTPCNGRLVQRAVDATGGRCKAHCNAPCTNDCTPSSCSMWCMLHAATRVPQDVRCTLEACWTGASRLVACCTGVSPTLLGGLRRVLAVCLLCAHRVLPRDQRVLIACSTHAHRVLSASHRRCSAASVASSPHLSL